MNCAGHWCAAGATVSGGLEAKSERDGHHVRVHKIVPSIVVSGLHVDFPVAVADSDRESHTSVQAAGGPTLESHGLGEYEVARIASISPIDEIGRAGSEGGDDVVLVNPGVAIVPTASGHSIETKTGPVDALNLEAVVRGQAVQIDTPEGGIDRMNREPVGRETGPHEFTDDRVLVVDVVSNARDEVAAQTCKSGGRIHRSREASPHVCGQFGSILSGD